MTDDTRVAVGTLLFVLGFGWFLGVEVHRKFTRNDSPRLFWLHLTAPLVAIVLMLVALWLVINTDRIRRQRGLAFNQAGTSCPSGYRYP